MLTKHSTSILFNRYLKVKNQFEDTFQNKSEQFHLKYYFTSPPPKCLISKTNLSRCTYQIQAYLYKHYIMKCQKSKTREGEDQKLITS